MGVSVGATEWNEVDEKRGLFFIIFFYFGGGGGENKTRK